MSWKQAEILFWIFSTKIQPKIVKNICAHSKSYVLSVSSRDTIHLRNRHKGDVGRRTNLVCLRQRIPKAIFCSSPMYINRLFVIVLEHTVDGLCERK